MAYFCFIESRTSSVPHMHPLMSTTLAEAIGEAQEMMRLHLSAIRAEVFEGEERVATIDRREEALNDLPVSRTAATGDDNPSA